MVVLLSAPSTLDVTTLPSESAFIGFHEFRGGSLTTTRGLRVVLPLTLLEIVGPPPTLVPPSTTWVPSSQTVVVVVGPQAELP
jgi:hypothetical protein